MIGIGSLIEGVGARSPDGVAYCVTLVVDPDDVVQHLYATSLVALRLLAILAH